MNAPRPAFTLIELLVVITIIVVLLALLAPALDQAVYQAELASCGARLKGLGGGVLQYALERKRRYPTPKALVGRHHTVVTTWGYDLRSLLKGYIDINGHLNCPLTRKIDIESSTSDGSLPLTGIMSAYSLWFDWRWTGFGSSEQAMSKLGDRFTWTEANGQVRRFSLLAGDWNDDWSGRFVQSSHPDSQGQMSQVHVQDGAPSWAPVGQTVTISWWERANGDERGLIDRSFVHDDGSVRRLDNQPWGDGPNGLGGRGPGDERMVLVPVFSVSQDGWSARKSYLPKE